MKVFQEFHERDILHKEALSDFIALIPKKEGLCRAFDFRPISLVGNMYKIVAKVLSCHPRLVMNDAISNAQSVFHKRKSNHYQNLVG